MNEDKRIPSCPGKCPQSAMVSLRYAVNVWHVDDLSEIKLYTSNYKTL
jgi:hypothetical protein